MDLMPFEIRRGESPIVVAFPHVGTFVPPVIWDRLNDNGRLLADTDWHVDRLYDGLLPGATMVRATFHRYVIDANRDPAGGSLYPGRNTTDLVPLTDFDGRPIWQPGCQPTAAEIADRVAAFHGPYHAALSAEVDRVRRLHGVAVVYDCHSIRSTIPYLFEGRLPDFNIGTDGGRTCSAAIERSAVDAVAGRSSVLNGRFKGGWTTRHYGRPGDGVHAIQMELAQSVYLKTESPPFDFDESKADRVRAILRPLLAGLAVVAGAIG